MCPQYGLGDAAVRSGSRFGSVGEGEGGGIDDSVVTDQRDRDLHWLPDPAPALSESRNVRHHTQDDLAASWKTHEYHKAFRI